MTLTAPRVLGLIPARGDSKGLPGKNIRLLHGRPLIAWCALAARSARTLDRVICSTDSRAIADVVREAGVSVPFMRPSMLAQDHTLVVDVLWHALDWLASHGEIYDYVCVIQPTSPLIQAEDIDQAVTLAIRKCADTVITGYRCGQKHPATMFYLKPDGAVEWLVPTEQRMIRRQDLVTVHIRSGLVYVISADLVLTERSTYGRRIFALEVPEERAISIDTELDFQIAELLMERLQRQETS